MRKKGKTVRIKVTAFAALALLIAVMAVGRYVYSTTVGSWKLDINLNGESEITLEYGSEWADPGADVILTGRFADKLGDKPQVKAEGSVDPNKVGSYEIKYSSFFDAYGTHLEAEKTRTVKVRDTVLPVISLNGEAEVSFREGEEWTDPGAVASDNADGDISGAITVEGGVDNATPGTYTITYSVCDLSGNPASVTRSVTVTERPKVRPADPAEGLSKVIYLTFDDGPGPYTEKLLGILDKYGVKATFFVTGHSSEYRYLIGTEAAKGHSVGAHSMTHDYTVIYSSTDAFWADIEDIEAIIEDQTGSRSHLLRFPGGSSNTVSASYCSGIMTKLTSQAEEKGYAYFDWNVSSGDAGETEDPNKVMQNIINNVQKHDTSVVLCHDVKRYTVEAMDKTIEWCLKSGYTFLPLSPGCYTAHHGVNN